MLLFFTTLPIFERGFTMKISQKVIDQLQADMENASTMDDLIGKNGVIKSLIKNLSEEMLAGELTQHLGYEKSRKSAKQTTNRRNGSSSKQMRSSYGEMSLQIPRDRNGEFDPILIEKYNRDLGPIEDKVLAMYARGMTTRDINAYLNEIYSIELSAAAISQITNQVLDKTTQWQNRPLDALYPIVYFDAIHFKVRADGRIVTKAAYTALGIDSQGYKELLGIWIDGAEGANFWHGIITEIRNRGVQDILIACVDGLKGLPEAIETVFPEVEVQLCVIHQIRNSLRYIAHKNKKDFMKDLKPVYQAPTEELGRKELDNLAKNWGEKYPLVIKSWQENWPRLSTYFKYSEEIRRLIYTTNIVEGLHRQFRKVTKTKSVFPGDEAVMKLLFMAQQNISKKWTKAQPKWPFIISQFALIFKERVKLDI